MNQKDHDKPESIELHCNNIERNEKSIQAFVGDTLDCARIRAHFGQLQAHHSPPLPALFGVLVGVKDVIQVDGFITRCGSALPAEMLTSAEAPLVTSLKQAGAIIAGKTHTTEFAISDPGPTCNPLNPAHTPGGSSSGSAAAVAAEAYRIHEPWFDQYREQYQPLSLKELEAGRAISDIELKDLQRAAKHAQLQMQQTMRDLAVDVWLAPSAPDVAPAGLANTGDYRINSIWSYTGLPVISIPTGRNHQNLAYGMQIIRRFGHDEKLLQIAKRLQQCIF